MLGKGSFGKVLLVEKKDTSIYNFNIKLLCTSFSLPND